MKKLLALLFVLVLCFAVVACNTGNSTKTDATQSNIEKAMAYVHELYKSDSKDGPSVDTGDVNLLTNVPIGTENFTVTWTIEKVNESDLDVAEIVTAEDGTLKVAIKYEAGYNTVATDYKLTVTVSNGTDTQSRTYNRQVPAFVYTNYDQWISNCEAGSKTVMNIKAYVIGVVSTSSSSGGSMYLQDAEGHGYYAYNPTLDAADKASDEALRAAYPVGCEVIVSGTGTVYGGQYEFNKGCTVKKTGESIDASALITADASEAFAAASDNESTTLIPYQNTLVTLTGCTLTSSDGSYYYFTIGENSVKFNIYDNTYFINADAQKAWKANFNPGYTATITGIVSCYSNQYQIYPVSAEVIKDLEAPNSKTFAASLALNPFASTVIPYATAYDLPLAGTGDNASVSIAWALDKEYAFVTLADGVLTVNLPVEKTTIKLTATLTAEGEATITKDFELTLNPSEINWTSVADAITACGALDGSSKETSTEWYYIKSTVIDTPTADYANFNFSDGTTNLKVYGLYDINGAQRYGTKRQIAEIPFGMGDTVALYCQLQNYNGTLEIVNARLLFVEKVEVTDEIKVATTKSELTLAGQVTEVGSIDLPAGKTYADVNISWALDAEYAFAKIEDGKLVISEIPATATTITVTATLTSGTVTDTVSFKIDVKKKAVMPAVETPFVFAVDQNKLSKTLYFTGAMSGNYFATTEDITAAVEVKIEVVEGGYRIYFMKDDAKTYIDIYEYTSGKAGVRLTTEPTAVFVFDEDLGVFTANVASKVWYLGTYNTFSTLSASETYRISGDNASAVGVSQFVCYFTTKTITDDIKVNAEKNITVDTVTAAGSVELPAAGKTYTEVTITGWTFDKEYDFAKIEDGKLVISDLPATETVITLTATVTSGAVTATATVTVTVKGKTIEWTTVEEAVVACGKLTSGTTSDGWYYIRGTVLDTPTETYANFNIGDANGNKLLVYGLSSMDGVIYGSKKSGTAAPIAAGDAVELYCQLQNYNGTLEIVNAKLYGTAEVTDTDKIAYEIGNITVDNTITAAGDKTLATAGTKYADVTITWTSDKSIAVISEDGSKVTYTLPTDDDVVVTLTATVKYGELVYTKAFNVTVKKFVDISSASYVKVTESKTDWSGTYLIVYEAEAASYAYNGIDAVNGCTAVTITDGVIEASDILTTCQVEIEKTEGGYTIKVTNPQKAGTPYISGKSGSNSTQYTATGSDCDITYDATNGCVVITSNSTTFKFNNASNQLRFRFYKSGQSSIQLFELTEA